MENERGEKERKNWRRRLERDEKENEKAWRAEAGGSNGWAAISRLHPRQELGAGVPIEKEAASKIFKSLNQTRPSRMEE